MYSHEPIDGRYIFSSEEERGEKEFIIMRWDWESKDFLERFHLKRTMIGAIKSYVSKEHCIQLAKELYEEFLKKKLI